MTARPEVVDPIESQYMRRDIISARRGSGTLGGSSIESNHWTKNKTNTGDYQRVYAPCWENNDGDARRPGIVPEGGNTMLTMRGSKRSDNVSGVHVKRGVSDETTTK